MSEPASDQLEQLFSPPLVPSPEASENPSSPMAVSEARQTFWVEPPNLNEIEKKQYKTLPPEFVASGVEFDAPNVDKIIGEYRDGRVLFYFARFQDGIAHKFTAAWFTSHHPELVKDYLKNKEGGKLDPFDPSAHYIHPRSRIRTTIIINPMRAFAKNPALKSASSKGKGNNIPFDYISSEPEEVPDSEEEDEEDTEEDEDYTKPARKSSRVKKKPIKTLPFSPKKTRAKKPFVVPDTEDEDENEVQEIVPTRKSSRSTKNAKSSYKEADDYAEQEEDVVDTDDEASPSPRKRKGKQPKKKKTQREKASRPAYGNIRDIHDLDYDDESDEETAPLRAHREVCEKCHKLAAHRLIEVANKKQKGKGQKKKKMMNELNEDLDDFEGDEIDRLNALGGWIRCLKCPVTAHWGCLARTQQDEILKATLGKDREAAEAAKAQMDADEVNEGVPAKPVKVWRRPGLTVTQTTEFICGSCIKGGLCIGCMEVALQPDTSSDRTKDVAVVKLDTDLEMGDSTQDTEDKSHSEPPEEISDTGELLFRCFTCKRLAHYEHLPVPLEYKNNDSVDAVMLAEYYQTTSEWLCRDCSSYTWGLDKILAWRPYPSNVIEPLHVDGKPHYKTPLPREYLVKWLDRSYHRTEWVPHMWLVSTNAAKLKNFLDVGPKVELLAEPLPEDAMEVDGVAEKGSEESQADKGVVMVPFEIGAEADPSDSGDNSLAIPLGAAPDAERRIPLAWKTVDRVLDILLWRSEGHNQKKMKKGKAKAKTKKRILESEEEDDETSDIELEADILAACVVGEQPSDDLTETIRDWEARTGQQLRAQHIKYVVWAFIKWDDLAYDEATWDSPPRAGEPGYAAFQTAFQRFVDSRQVQVMNLPADEVKKFDKRAKDKYKKSFALDREKLEQPVLGQNKQLSLMPFQIDGVNWLCDNWWRLQHCILADDMGLGKTVQIVTFLGTIIDKWNAFPALVVVPNSTITNWVREFEKWAPKLRVVPFYGEAKSREVIKKFELRHEQKAKGTTGAKFHVLVTTYESLNNPKDFAPVFKSVGRWEVLVVDEGQRLKSDSSLLFKKLNELKSIHRIILTGTPLNNNIRELFNLMNFLDPNEWTDLEALEKEHETLTEELIKQLHERLRPYFLRRIKSEVLQLPPKNEVIVPVSMAPLQKEVYRSVLSKNLEILKVLSKPSNAKVNATMGKLNNMLMQLRKCLQHPYLIDDDIEPRGLSVKETQYKLIDGSAKLRFLKTLLPQLKARGHRVLLFSQFVIGLNIVEDFLNGEGFKYLRLDGSTKQVQRQKDMDEFNRADSDIFIFLLTTRAGGVGINLFTADTVIIFDPDFNPHQDLQVMIYIDYFRAESLTFCHKAIARAYRYGQKKTCLVFKLMVKDSAEERIMQTGKKKLVLDHLIVQKMDEDDSAGDDVQSILTYGAKALFEEGEQGARDIVYTENDIEKLIERTEKEGDQPEPEKKEGFSFAFAKIWSAEKDVLEEVADETPENNDQDDAWAQTLARIAAEREKVKAQEVTGRGVRRRAAAAVPMLQPMLDLEDTPAKKKASNKQRSKEMISDESDAYTGSAAGGSDADETSDDNKSMAANELRTLAEQSERKRARSSKMPSRDGPLSPIQNTKVNRAQDASSFCGLCGTEHRDGACYMTERSENLVEYRQLLILHADDEPMEERQAAIRVIDETLYKRGKLHLIDGQPLHLLEKKFPPPPRPVPKKDHLPSQLPSASASLLRPASEHASGSGFPMDTASSGSGLRTASLYSKRASSPLPVEEPSSKKAKLQQATSGCIICGGSYHLVKDCPTVLQGPKSVAKEIKRLQDNPKYSSTVLILTKILKKQKRRELAQSAATTSDAVIISD